MANLTDLAAAYEQALADALPFAELAELSAALRDAAAAGTRVHDDPEPRKRTRRKKSAPVAEGLPTDEELRAVLPSSTDAQRAFGAELIDGMPAMFSGTDEIRAAHLLISDPSLCSAEVDAMLLELLRAAEENRRTRPLGDEAPALPDGTYRMGSEVWQVARVATGAVKGLTLRPVTDGTPGPAVRYQAKKREILAALTSRAVVYLRAHGRNSGTCGLCSEALPEGPAARFGIHGRCLAAA